MTNPTPSDVLVERVAEAIAPLLPPEFGPFARSVVGRAALSASNVEKMREALEQIANDPYQYGQRVQRMKEIARAALRGDHD